MLENFIVKTWGIVSKGVIIGKLGSTLGYFPNLFILITGFLVFLFISQEDFEEYLFSPLEMGDDFAYTKTMVPFS